MKRSRHAKNLIHKEQSLLKDHSWIVKMSRQNKLCLPSQEVIIMVNKCERMFLFFHKHSLRKKDPFNRLTKLILEKKPHFNSEIVTKFIKVRTYARQVLKGGSTRFKVEHTYKKISLSGYHYFCNVITCFGRYFGISTVVKI